MTHVRGAETVGPRLDDAVVVLIPWPFVGAEASASPAIPERAVRKHFEPLYPGVFVARLDMAYDEVKVGIEYDGPQHWEGPAVRQRDIDEQFELTALDWFIIRVSRDLLRYRRPTYVGRVETALRERGIVLP